MLIRPQNGWSRITIKDWSERCSYLDDVPMKLLDAFALTIFYKTPNFVRFDAEGWEYLIVFSVNSVEIFTENPTDEYYNTPIYRYQFIPINLKELALELLSDVRQNLEAWVLWNTNTTEAEFCKWLRENRKTNLIRLCNRLEKILHETV